MMDPVRLLEELEGLPKSPPTKIPCQLKNCPEPLKELNNDASSTLFYRAISGEQPLNKCLKDKSAPPVRDLESVFIKTLKTSDEPLATYPSACAPDVVDRGQRQSLLFTQHQYYRERINRGAIQSLLALHEIDSVLTGSPSAMKGIKCDSGISSKVKNVCQKLKQCPRTSQRDALVNLTYGSLKRRMELEKSLERFDRKVRYLSRRAQKRSNRNRPEFQERLKHTKEIRNTLKKTIQEIESATPWIRGRIFEKNLSKIEEGIAQERDEASLKKEIEANLIGQSQVNKREILRLYDQLDEGVDCLKGKQDCDRFSRILSKTPPALPELNPYAPPLAPDIQTAYDQFGIVQCMEKEIDTAKTYGSVALTAGEIGLGLAIGGVGGIAALGRTSLKVLSSGYRIKAAMSLLGLGALGVTTYKNFNLLKLKCKEASRHLIGIKEGNSSVACLPKSYPQNVSQYLSCLTEIALTGAAVGPAVLGKGVRLAKGGGRIRLAKSKNNQVKRASDIKNSEDLKEFRSLLSSDQSMKFGRLLDEFSLDELKMIRPYLKTAKESKIDPLVLHRALRYSRTIRSTKKRQNFLNHLDEALGGEADSANRQVRNFLRTEKFHGWNVARLEKKYKKKKVLSEAGQESALELAKQKSHRIQDVLLSCASRNMNASHQRAIKVFGGVTTGLVGASTVTGFTAANWQKPKDMEWFGKLGYELVYAMMYNKIMVKVMKNPTSNFWKRQAQFGLSMSSVDGVDSTIYSQFFSIDEGDARDALNRIKNNPEKKRALEELSQYLDDTGFVDRFKEALVGNMRNLFKTSQASNLASGEVIEEEGLPEELRNLKEKDLDDPKVQDKLLEAVMAQYYDKEKGFMNFGSKGLERFTFSRSWSTAIGIPKNVAVAVPIYFSLCVTSIWPVGGLLAAAGLQALNQLSSADWYFKTRNYMINQ